MSTIYTISEISKKISSHCATLFPFVWVQGEVVNLSLSSKNNLYFSLKDSENILDCVWFFSKQKTHINYNLLTGEVLDTNTVCLSKTIKTGDYIYCAGTISIYKERSKYQLIVDLAEYAGKGEYEENFLLLKEKLALEGLFSPLYKKSIPKNPQNIFLITARTSAALQDFLYVAQERSLDTHIQLYNTTVQGKDTVLEIINAIQLANKSSNTTLIVLIRGGGSKEELAVFNEERIVRAIFSSVIPVITGIGHEINMSLADLVADESCITPTHVAQKIWDSKETIAKKINTEERRMFDLFMREIHKQKLILAYLDKNIQQKLPYILIKQNHTIVFLLSSLYRSFSALFSFYEKIYQNIYFKLISKHNNLCSKHLLSFSTSLQKLSLSISVCYKKHCEKYLFLIKKLEKIRLSMLFLEKLYKLEYFLQKIYTAILHSLERFFYTLNVMEKSVYLLSPITILKRGYSCIENKEGLWVKLFNNTSDEVLFLRFYNGVMPIKIK